MIDDFLQHIAKNQLFDQHEQILLTISGGIDSMTMFDLFHKQGYHVGVAHCNFMLRGEESNQDQEFVKKLAVKNNVLFHTVNFNTKQFASEKKISIQMAARDLRYNWFNQIAKEFGYSKIATAHNLNDLSETFLINLSRGTGIKGLTGIPVKSDKLIRPLLFAARDKIRLYANQNNIDFREDSSNVETKYLRNAIRHKIIKNFEQISPNFLHAVETTSKLLNATRLIYEEKIEKLRIIFGISLNLNETRINIGQLQERNIQAEILFDILLPYNFTYDNCQKIINSIDHQSGLSFYSNTHRLIKDRNTLIITKNNIENDKEYLIKDKTTVQELPFMFRIDWIKPEKLETLKCPTNKAIFDAEKIIFPLKLRRWKKGDSFYPFGMKGRKKISDYFSDNKFSIAEKEKTWILTSGEDIIWIVNHRTDNRFRITDKTKQILLIETDL